jgi:hypothetical protein
MENIESSGINYPFKLNQKKIKSAKPIGEEYFVV